MLTKQISIFSAFVFLSFNAWSSPANFFVQEEALDCGPNYKSCAEAAIEKSGYVYDACLKIQNDSQDRCAGAAIIKSGYVYDACLRLDSGGLCAAAAIEKSGYVYDACSRVKNSRQDRCAAAAIKKSGYVYDACLNL